jgi:hypothetical protein
MLSWNPIALRLLRCQRRGGYEPYPGGNDIEPCGRICLQTTGGSNWSAGNAVGTITIFGTPS